MKATYISKEDGKAKFSMEFTGDELEDATVKAYQKNKDKYSVDGFRKGKAPRGIIEKRYGETVFLEDAINYIFNSNYPKAIEDLNLEVIDRPAVEFSQIEKGEDFTATVTVEVYPEIEVKDYEGVEIEQMDAEVTEEDIDQDISSMRKRNARMNNVDRPVKDGDMVILDYEGYVDGEKFEGGSAEEFPLKIGSGSFIAGFEDQLIGAEKEKDLEVKVRFPDEYHAKDLAGKDAIFKCKIHDIKEEELPELDDEFAKDVSEFDTIKELRDDVEKKLKDTKESYVKTQMKDKALEQVYNANEVDVPDVMINDEIDNMLQEFDQQLRSQGMDLQKYCEYLEKDMKDFREEVKDDAYKRVKTRMLVNAIADKEGMEATEEEVNEQMEQMAKQYKIDIEKIKEMMNAENVGFIEKDIKMKKAVDYIFDKAVIKEAEKAAEDTEEK